MAFDDLYEGVLGLFSEAQGAWYPHRPDGTVAASVLRAREEHKTWRLAQLETDFKHRKCRCGRPLSDLAKYRNKTTCSVKCAVAAWREANPEKVATQRARYREERRRLNALSKEERKEGRREKLKADLAGKTCRCGRSLADLAKYRNRETCSVNCAVAAWREANPERSEEMRKRYNAERRRLNALAVAGLACGCGCGASLSRRGQAYASDACRKRVARRAKKDAS